MPKRSEAISNMCMCVSVCDVSHLTNCQTYVALSPWGFIMCVFFSEFPKHNSEYWGFDAHRNCRLGSVHQKGNLNL